MDALSVLNPSAEPGWKNYEDFAQGIDTNRLPSTRHWQGKNLNLTFEGAEPLRLDFHQEALSWRWGNERGVSAVDEVYLSPDRYFFSFALDEQSAECLAMVINCATRRVLAVRCGILPVGETQGGSRLTQAFFCGALGDAAPGGKPPELTRELIGYRTLNIYSPHHYYEHVYINTERYAWQNLRGEQFGHGDMDYATYYKFEPDMYLFTFREKIIPVCSVFFFDYQTGRCTGIFMGITASGDVQIRPAGALISKMSFTCYPTGVAPL